MNDPNLKGCKHFKNNLYSIYLSLGVPGMFQNIQATVLGNEHRAITKPC